MRSSWIVRGGPEPKGGCPQKRKAEGNLTQTLGKQGEEVAL